jgi:hypothetical protein
MRSWKDFIRLFQPAVAGISVKSGVKRAARGSGRQQTVTNGFANQRLPPASRAC